MINLEDNIKVINKDIRNISLDDLKNIRQSAVKMSVGQKQGASQIVKDWLDDGGDNNEENTENNTEETEE